MNVAHEVRELLASLGYRSLRDIRGKTDLLHLIDHPCMVGQLNLTKMLREVEEVKIEKPIYLEAGFKIDDAILSQVKAFLENGQVEQLIIEGDKFKLNNNDKTVGGQVAIDIERILNYELKELPKFIYTHSNGRRYLAPENPPASIDNDPILIPPTPKVKSSFLMNRDFLRTTDPRWVSLEKVIHYLERQGNRVKTNDAALDDYHVDGKPVKASYLLLLANRLRIEESKPIFMVSEVTW
jgi:hypothetical protein